MKFKAIIFIILSIGAFMLSCQVEDKTTLKKFTIMASASQASGINGFFKLDGKANQYFNVSTLTSGYYVFEMDLESPDTLLVSVNSTNNWITSIELFIYDDTDLIKDVLETPTYSDGTCSTTLSCYYDFSTSTSASSSP
jgi:hypothetical protein